MKGLLGAVILILLYQVSIGQIDTPKFSPPIESTKSKFESLNSVVQSKIDSVTNPIAISSRLDSIENNLNSSIDSLTYSYSKGLAKIQFESQRYRSKIDSLQSLKLPSDMYKGKMDSLSQMLTSFQEDLTTKIEGIKKKATDKITELLLPPELKEKVAALSNSIANLNGQTLQSVLPENLTLDQLGRPTTDILRGAAIPDLNVPGTQSVIGALFSNQTLLPDVPGLKDINGMENITGLGERAGDVQSKVSEVADFKPESIDRLAESNMSRLKVMQGIQEQIGDLPTTSIKSEEEMKAELKDQAQAIAVDHFANNQEQLNAAMTKISQYKATFSNVNSLADISKKPPNAMKGKPLIERIVPGLGLQVQKREDVLLVDFNPYAGYRFTGRITGGAGWNQRVPYNMDKRRFSSTVRIYGPRVYGEFKLGRGFAPRVEIELMHTLVPPFTLSPTLDPEHSEWVWGVFAGIKKEYKIFRELNGTASVMMRLFDPHHKSPYADVVNARLGFEIPLKKKVKAPKQ
ncbi:MAG TPA: hypothetical protein VK589_28940 [Chryseolinea sp.]|nr:hypothetical protein [Chryseolinea sp.]